MGGKSDLKNGELEDKSGNAFEGRGSKPTLAVNDDLPKLAEIPELKQSVSPARFEKDP